MSKKAMFKIIWAVDNLSPNIGLDLLERCKEEGKIDLNDEAVIFEHINEIIRERNLLDEKMKSQEYLDLSTLLRKTLRGLDPEILEDFKLYIYGSHEVVEKIDKEVSFEKKTKALCSLFYFSPGTIIDSKGNETYIDISNGNKLVYPHDPVTALINVQRGGFDLYPYLRKLFNEKIAALKSLLSEEKMGYLYELCGFGVQNT